MGTSCVNAAPSRPVQTTNKTTDKPPPTIDLSKSHLLVESSPTSVKVDNNHKVSALISKPIELVGQSIKQLSAVITSNTNQISHLKQKIQQPPLKTNNAAMQPQQEYAKLPISNDTLRIPKIQSLPYNRLFHQATGLPGGTSKVVAASKLMDQTLYESIALSPNDPRAMVKSQRQVGEDRDPLQKRIGYQYSTMLPEKIYNTNRPATINNNLPSISNFYGSSQGRQNQALRSSIKRGPIPIPLNRGESKDSNFDAPEESIILTPRKNKADNRILMMGELPLFSEAKL